MKTFDKMAAQGDLVVRRIDAIPKSAKKTLTLTAHDAPIIVGHSETGHHHAFRNGGVVMYECDPPNPLLCYLRVEQPAALEHMRPWDTHESILFAPGDYEIRRQREYVPEGWRRVQD